MQTRGNILSYGEGKISIRDLGKRLSVASVTKKMGDRVQNMSSDRLQKKRKADQVANMAPDRKRKREESVIKRSADLRKARSSDTQDRTPNVNGDAAKYLEHFNGKTRMWICGVCGSDEGENDLKVLDDIVAGIVARSDLPVLFARVVHGSDDSVVCDEYIDCIRNEFHANGLLKCAKHVCKTCLKELRKGKYADGKEKSGLFDESVYVEDEDGDEEEEGDESDGEEEADIVKMHSGLPLNVPKTAYLRGLYPGIVPFELRDLRTVELSMVSIYNPITRLKINCKGVSYKYFHGRANMYSIVNDVTQVASVLPQIPSVNTFAILKYTNDVCTKELRYRPGMVRRALDWLKVHNHLYKDITIEYPTEWSTLEEDCELEPESLLLDETEQQIIESEAVSNFNDASSGDASSATAVEENDIEGNYDLYSSTLVLFYYLFFFVF